MCVYLRGTVYWYSFQFKGQHFKGSTKQREKRAATAVEHQRRIEVGATTAAPLVAPNESSIKELIDDLVSQLKQYVNTHIERLQNDMKIVQLSNNVPASCDADEMASKCGVSAERLLELAEMDVIPHMRIDGGPPVFVPAETKKWIADNLVVSCGTKSLPSPSMIIVHDKSASKWDVPPQLRLLDGLVDITYAVSSGVYFLCKGRKVVYIGQSGVVGGRIATHLDAPDKVFDRILFLKWPKSGLCDLEGALIRAIKPPLNFKANGVLLAPGDPSNDQEIMGMISSQTEPQDEEQTA